MFWGSHILYPILNLSHVRPTEEVRFAVFTLVKIKIVLVCDAV
jgi:hypothetical protein